VFERLDVGHALLIAEVLRAELGDNPGTGFADPVKERRKSFVAQLSHASKNSFRLLSYVQ